MNLVLMRAFWRERFTSPIRLLLILTLWGFGLLLSFLQRPIPMPQTDATIWPVLILGAGVIGRDLSSGVLQLILARPVGRTEYVMSRWLALAAGGAVVAFVGWLLALPFSLATGGTTLMPALGLLVEHLFTAFGLAAVVTGLSALLPGFGDLALLLMGFLASKGVELYGTLGRHPWAVRLGDEVGRTLMPQLELKSLVAGGGAHLYPLAVWASAVTLFLLLGVVAMNRKELSYATAG